MFLFFKSQYHSFPLGYLKILYFSLMPWQSCGIAFSAVCSSAFMLSHFCHVQLCNPMDYSPPGSSVHGILQARIQEWVAMPSSKGSSWPRNQTSISYITWIGRWVFFVCLFGWLVFFFFFLPLVPPGKQACNRKNSKTASEFLSQSASSIREELCNSEQGSSSLEIQFFLW